MTAISHRGLVAKEIIGTPGDDVRLPRWDLDDARRAQILLLSAIRRNVAHEPLSA